MTDGTTIIAMKYNGGIMLAADGRSSNVSFINQISSIYLFVSFSQCMSETNAKTSWSQFIKEFIARDQEHPPILV